MTDYTEEEPDDFVYYGSSLDPLEEDDLPSKKPIRIEDQIVTDENGKRRFHGAFTGGFSAGYWNSVGSKEGWRPSEFKSSRSDRKQVQQKPQDFMDDEDLGAFGIAPQVLRAKDDYGENHVSKKRLKTVFAPQSAIPGLSVLHGLLHPVKETIGIKLLRSMGWRPNQGTGERVTKKEKKERRKKAEKFKSYGCLLPPGFKGPEPTSDGDGNESEEDSEQLFAPDDIPTFTVQPKENTFGLGYTGLVPRGSSAATSKGHFVLFEPTLSVTDKKKKLQIKGQAFGVGAFETEDADIYAKDDMSQYDFELGPSRKEKKSTKLLALQAPDLLDGFVRATKPDPSVKFYQLPDLPRDWVPIHRNKKSRFDVKPLTENELKGLGRHDLNAYQRAVILDEVLEVNTPSSVTVQSVQAVQAVQSVQTSQKTIEQQISTFDFDSLLSQVKMGVAHKKAATTVAQPPDPEKEMKRAELRKFIEGSVKATTFQPFAKEPEKQFRFDAFNLLSKCGRMAEFHVLYPDSMTEWERERERVEFERAQELYRPLCGMMQNRFQSAGQIEENIQGGLVVELDTLVTRETPSKRPEVKETDPAKRAAHRKHFGPLTRQRAQWKPDRLLCIRFNIPNPFPDGKASGAAVATKGVPKRPGQKFNIFDVLDVTTPPQVIQPKEMSAPAPQVQDLEWNKAERGELQDTVEPEEAGPSRIAASEVQGPAEAAEVAEEEPVPYERPPMDLFKAIFEGSESEEEEEKMAGPSVEAEAVADVAAAVKEVDESEDDVYGPRAPQGGLTKRPFVSGAVTAADDDDWVEKGHETKKRKKEHKKKKKSSDKKKKKDRKKKKKRSKSSDSSSSSDTDDDEIILRKLVHLKKKHGM